MISNYKFKPIVTLLGITIAAIMILSLTGCSSQGMTSSEIHQAHMRSIRVDMLQMQEDVDSMLLIDQPSRLSDKYTR
jgi:hypothetical protein